LRIGRRSFLAGLSLSVVPLISAHRLARAGSNAADMPWIKARALHPGDAIMIVAPAGPADQERLEACRRRFESAGFRVIIPKGIYRRDRYLAGTDDERAAELNSAIRDPLVRAIFPCRGGYGLMRILQQVDYKAIRDDPKIITGYSDLTALHLAIARHSRVITFHSPMPQSSLYRDDGDHAYSSSSFWRVVRGEGFDNTARSRVIDLPKDRPVPTRLVGGRATGRLVGGNLTLICSSLGTPYSVEADGNILLIEDTGEAPYRVDRMFAQLRLAGVLDRVAGLLIGTFDETDAKAVDAVVREHCSRLKVPVIQNFPAGHTPFNTTLPHGGLVDLDADKAQVSLLENPVLASTAPG
jgi:muramoyltetrapeptide carboxypeptidase